MSLALIPLCTLTSTPAEAVDLGVTPSGQRYMVEILEAQWEGERFRAHLKEGTVAADWLVIGPDGTGHIDIRLTLETDYGALLYLEYLGRRDFTKVQEGIDAPVYITPRFETSDERYLWLNKIQAVGKGMLVGERRVYEVYELR